MKKRKTEKSVIGIPKKISVDEAVKSFVTAYERGKKLLWKEHQEACKLFAGGYWAKDEKENGGQK